VLFGLMMGESGRFAPYVLMSQLPMLGQFRLPSRYTLVFVLFAAGLLGWVMREAAGREGASDGLRRLAAALLLLGTASLAYQNRVHLAGAFPLPPLGAGASLFARSGPPAIDATTNGITGDSPMLRAMMENRAVLSCYEPLRLPGNVDPNLPLVAGSGATRVSEVAFTPNRVGFGVIAGAEPGRVVLNAKFIEGWRTSVGTLELDPASGLAHVVVPPWTASRVELRFVPPGLAAGFALFGVGLLLAAASLLFRRGWRRSDPVPS
jgi:hypothetical protein